ncbi:DUF4266 domain-containing protein [Methylomonas methanica]|uniref:Arginine decarboxylase n=1 Tax=Methylomonas methanica (strain DSM 25384 / MC09) TaxID=857087 RepID=F9ZZ67_METMM|nr:DUF4266 domain-containing protein [Methylomonas methanica]AEG01093.1 arginine decarboxylase [Methylomonas methanica MC09]
MNYLLIIVAVLSAFLQGGCSVAPWERGTLAKPQMALEPNPLQTELRGHVYGSREAATTSGSGAGGGCGCY